MLSIVSKVLITKKGNDVYNQYDNCRKDTYVMIDRK